MDFQPHPLNDILTKLETQGIELAKARHSYLRLEAERKHFESQLVKQSTGISQASKLHDAQASEAWLGFHLDLANAESVFEFQRLKYVLMEKEWQSQYLALKLDHEGIKRGQE